MAKKKDLRQDEAKTGSAVRELPDGPADATGLTPRQRRV
ncbi:MAG: repressor LexA, partial [Nocardioidaceae bacterium]|nr:repressor LexA [Nocardioidaceae bacterium]